MRAFILWFVMRLMIMSCGRRVVRLRRLRVVVRLLLLLSLRLKVGVVRRGLVC